jgi:hypothetical protein
MAMLLVTMLSAPVNFLVQLPMLDVRYREFGAAIWRPLVATLMMSFRRWHPQLVAWPQGRPVRFSI